MRIKFSAIHGLLTLFFCSLVSLSCSDTLELPDITPEEPVVSKRMTLVYMMAENSLASYAKKDIDEMVESASLVPDDCVMLVFVDDAKFPRICRVYDKDGVATCDTVHRFANDFCSSDTTNMRIVFDWLYEHYPAESLNLVMWSHGSGWVDGTMQHASIQKSIGVDNEINSSISNNTFKAIETDELACFLKKQPMPVELLMFDACFMQTAETVFELRNSAKWILASPAEIPGDGAPYDKIMESLFAFPMNAQEIMNQYYQVYKNDRYGVLLSLVDCSAVEDFAMTTARYIPALFNRENSINFASLFSYLPNGYFKNGTAYYPDYVDMNSAMKTYLPAVEYDAWKQSLDRAVPYAVASDSWYSAPHRSFYSVDRNDYCGLSMYIPRETESYKNYNLDFSSTQWYQYAGWKYTGW